MEAVESNPATFDLEAEIAKTAELIQKLNEAEEFIKRQQIILLGKVYKIDEQIYGNKHRKLKVLIEKLMPLIESLEKFPTRPEPYQMKIQSLSPTAKEIAEPAQKLKVQFQHRNKNLATERKLAKELQRQKENEKKQYAADRIKQEKMQKNPYYIVSRKFRFRGCRVLPKKNTQGLIRIWVEELLYVSSLVLHDSKNLDAPRRSGDHHLHDLSKTADEFYRTQNIGRAEFEKKWETMKRDKKSLEVIKFEPVKESRRHQEGYDESERLTGKTRELHESFDDEFRDEWKRINKEQMAKCRYL